MEHDDIVLKAVQEATKSGTLTASEQQQLSEFVGSLTSAQRSELAKVARLYSKAKAIDWSVLLDVLPALLALIPGVGPFAGLIMKLLPFLLSLVTDDNIPTPTPVPDGGGTIPDPIA